MSQHTPGPWKLDASKRAICTMEGWDIARLLNRNGPIGINEMTANARLIVKAPELLAAAKRGLAVVDRLRLALRRGQAMGLTAEDWQEFERDAMAVVREIEKEKP